MTFYLCLFFPFYFCLRSSWPTDFIKTKDSEMMKWENKVYLLKKYSIFLVFNSFSHRNVLILRYHFELFTFFSCFLMIFFRKKQNVWISLNHKNMAQVSRKKQMNAKGARRDSVATFERGRRANIVALRFHLGGQKSSTPEKRTQEKRNLGPSVHFLFNGTRWSWPVGASTSTPSKLFSKRNLQWPEFSSKFRKGKQIQTKELCICFISTG